MALSEPVFLVNFATVIIYVYPPSKSKDRDAFLCFNPRPFFFSLRQIFTISVYIFWSFVEYHM